jgi:hypothetical protein
MEKGEKSPHEERVGKGALRKAGKEILLQKEGGGRAPCGRRVKKCSLLKKGQSCVPVK